MIKDMIKDYFLNKPGTFEDEEDQKHVALNLASERLVEVGTHNIEIKLNKQMSKQLHRRFEQAKMIKTEGQFEWNEIPMDSQMSINDLYEFIDYSYESAMDTLSEHEQKEILDLEW